MGDYYKYATDRSYFYSKTDIILTYSLRKIFAVNAEKRISKVQF